MLSRYLVPLLVPLLVPPLFELLCSIKQALQIMSDTLTRRAGVHLTPSLDIEVLRHF